ncbi:MAG: ABC transporter substrate-binding protein [Thermodesulfobacteriota bacterium]
MMRLVRIVLVLLALFAVAGRLEAASFVDEAGRTITVTKPFTRIISLYSAHTENLFSLGLDREIVGVSRSEDFPPAALAKPVFDYRADPERILAARPDLVLIRPMIERSHPQLMARLEAAGITVVSLQPVSIDETYTYWRQLGLLTGRAAAAEAMVQRCRQELAAIDRIVAAIPAAQRQRVYFEAIHAKMKTFAPTSMAAFVLEKAGGINVAADAERVRATNIANYGKERILAKAAEIDVFLAQQGPMNRVEVATIVNEPGFAAIKAVREGRVHLVAEELVSRPTLRLVAGIRQLGRLLYPDHFKVGR